MCGFFAIDDRLIMSLQLKYPGECGWVWSHCSLLKYTPTGTCHSLSSNGIARSSSPLTDIRVDSIQQIESPNTGLSPQISFTLLLLVLG